MQKTFTFDLDSYRLEVRATSDGDARYMVYLSAPEHTLSNVRIGYLTGANRTWVGEFFGGKRPSVVCKSAKAACEALATVAITQPGIARFLTVKAGA